MKRVPVTLVASIVIFIFMLCQSAQAATVRASDNVNIAPDTVINDDLYVSGGSVVVNGTINGDLIVASGNVTIDGTVRDDLIAAGGNITVSGQVGQSARIGGGSISIAGNIGEDLVVGGGNVNVSSGSSIGRDVLLGAGDARISGNVGRNVRGGAGTLTIDSSVGNDVRVDVGQLILTDRANINGDLIYTSENQARIADGAQVGGDITRREPPPDVRGPTLAQRVASFIAAFLAAYIFGVVLLLLFPVGMVRVADAVGAAPWVVALGLALFILIPVAAIILMVLVLTLPLGITLLFLYILGIYLGKVFVGLAVGRAIAGRYNLNINNYVALLGGLLLLLLLGLIPIIGPLIRFIYILFGLGAVSYVLYLVIRGRVTASA